MSLGIVIALRQTRARCADGGWSGFPATLDQHRIVCRPEAEEATFFDLIGALQASTETADEMVAAWNVLDEFTGGTVTWEDTPGRTEADVLKLLDRAIARSTAITRKGKQCR